MKIRAFLVPALSLALLPALATAQVTIHVPADIATIKGAILAASDGDTILVAPGTYIERDVSLLGKAIHLASTGGPLVTTIDASFLGRGFLFTTGEGSDTVVEGFRVINGRSVASHGGGVMIFASPVIRDCRFEACQASNGSNSASTGGTGVQGYSGGGLWVAGGDPLVERCVFLNNRAGDGGRGGPGANGQDGAFLSPPTNGGQGGSGGLGGFGGAVFVSGGSPVFRDLYFTGNSAGRGGFGGTGGSGGDGIALQDGADGGRGGTGGSGGLGGTAYVLGGTPRFVNCTLVGNLRGPGGSGGSGGFRGTGGAGASNGSNGPTGFSGSSGNHGGILGPASALLQNSIAWANDAPQLGGVTASSCDVQGGYPGSGNIAADPLLAGSSLLAGSPCIDAGNDLWVPAGSASDLAGGPRFFDHPLVPSATPGSTVDMGCDEFAAPFVLPYGCGPAGSLALVSGTPAPGSTLSFQVDDSDARLGARAALIVGSAPAPAPCGTPTNGGKLLVDLAQPYSLVLGHGVGLQAIDLVLPPDPALVGVSLFVQGATLAPQGARPGASPARDPLTWSLLEAVQVVIGP